jgi:glycosyltransferase involved in cell wall biosynthesis
LLIGIYITNHIIYTYYFSKLFNIPYISVIIGDEFSTEEKLNKFYKYISKSSAIIVRGNFTKEMLSKKGFSKNKIYIIPNSFNFDKINKFKELNKKYDFIFTGNLVPIKRLDIMIEAFRILKTKYKIETFKAVIIGNGKLKQYLSELIEESNLTNNVQIIDFTNEILEYYHNSKVFIMTSEYEGLPMSMIEALACGIPVIMPNLSNISDVVINGYNGLLVEPLDVNRFAQSMYELYSIKELYESLSEGANNFTNEYKFEYSYENIQNEWNRLFSELAD